MKADSECVILPSGVAMSKQFKKMPLAVFVCLEGSTDWQFTCDRGEKVIWLGWELDTTKFRKKYIMNFLLVIVTGTMFNFDEANCYKGEKSFCLALEADQFLAA